MLPLVNPEPGWTLRQKAYDKSRHGYYETLFCLGNGYIGLRNTLEFESENSIPGVFLADVYDSGIAVRTEIANAMNWLPIQFYICGETAVNFDYANILSFERLLNTQSGTVHVDIRVEDAAGRITTLQWLVLVHIRHLHLGVISGTIIPENYSGTVGIASYLDWRFGNSYMGGLLPQIHTRHFEILAKEFDAAAGLYLEAETYGTKVRLAEAAKLVVEGEVSRCPLHLRGRVGELVHISAQQGRPCRFSKYATFFHSGGEEQLASTTKRSLENYLSLSVDQLVVEQQSAWKERWQTADVKIEGDAQAQETMRFCIFHLLQSSDPSRTAFNIAARGLTSEYHSGHFFFNTEFYKLPYWIYTNPPVARSLLMFRYNTLNAARQHALASGFRGARFPEEVDLTGMSATPWEIKDYFSGKTYYEWSGPETYFISAAVAYGIFVYYQATQDHEFMWNYGLEMLLETARFGVSILQRDSIKNRFDIKSVMGPDEYHYHVDNNFFTNYIVRWNIRFACTMFDSFSKLDDVRSDRVARGVGVEQEEFMSWYQASELIDLPRTSPVGVIEQHEGYFDLPDQTVVSFDETGRPVLSIEDAARAQCLQNFETQLIKEADIILLMYLFPEDFTATEKAANFSYYVKRTTHESSLSASPYGIVAAEIGDLAAAHTFFNLAGRYNIDFIPKENYRNGLHLAAYAGAWQIAVHGFAGLHVLGNELCLDPRLPPSWKSIAFKIWWRGNLMDFLVRPDIVEVRLIKASTQGCAARIQIAGSVRTLECEVTQVVPYTPIFQAN